MTNWQDDNSSAWHAKFLQAFWDSTEYNWDDTSLVWNAISDEGWHTKDAGSW